jgi:hypothetical protein
MKSIHKTNRNITLGLVLALLSGVMFSASSWAAAQPDRPDRNVSRERPAAAQPDRPDRRVSSERPVTAQPDHRRLDEPRFHDSRYHHDRDYPARGQVFRQLPRDHRVVVHGGARYYFSGGAWYRPQGPRFSVIIPPVGLFLPFLPPYYSTIWVRGVPYYYANEVYYGHRGDGYVVVEPPKEEPSQAPPPADQMFIYPRLGQNEQQQADDKYACHQWAVSQTGFDPTQPPGSMSEPQKIEKRADYQRAMGACLDGRGYTVK